MISSRLDFRREKGGGTFSFSAESGSFSGSSVDIGRPRLLDLRGIGIGDDSLLTGSVAARGGGRARGGGCAFSLSTSGCVAVSVLPTVFRRFLNGRYHGMAKQEREVFHMPILGGFERAEARVENAEGAASRAEKPLNRGVRVATACGPLRLKPSTQ